MDPRLLLKALMERDGDNPNSLAGKLRGKTKQPQIHKFLVGTASEPRRSTLQPVADHYGVSIEAFYDASLADKVHGNLVGGKPLMEGVLSPAASVAGAISIGDRGLGKSAGLEPTLAHLRAHLAPYLASGSNREIVLMLLADLLDGKRSPSDVDGVVRALGVPGEANARQA